MPTTTTEKHCFFSRVLQRETIDSEPGQKEWLPFTIYLAKQTRSWYDHPLDITYENSPGDGICGSILYSYADHRRGYTSLMARLLSNLGVPQQEHPTILDKLFGVVSSAVPKGRILVLIADVSVRLLGSFHDLDVIDTLMCENPSVNFSLEYRVKGELRFETHTMEGLDYHGFTTTIDTLTLESFGPRPRIVRFIPATRSSIQSLQKVKLDCLEEATIKRNQSCCICKDVFGADQLVIPLPCTHCYHVGCIVSWLELNHLCPLCRYAMPTVEQGDRAFKFIMEANR